MILCETPAQVSDNLGSI